MEKYKTSKDFYQQETAGNPSLNLLEQVLNDAKPVVSSTVDAKYDLNSRPSELSSHGYGDITD